MSASVRHLNCYSELLNLSLFNERTNPYIQCYYSGKDTSESSVAYNIDASNVVDGDLDTMLHTSDQTDDPTPWLKIDMGAEKLVISVSVQNRPIWSHAER